MSWSWKLSLRFRALFRKGGVEQELDEELRFHLDRQIEENMAAGMSLQEARYAARRTFGGVEQIKEACRDMHGVNFIETLIQDFRYGLRMLWKNPGFALIVVTTLALGIGANTAIFSVVNAVLLRPLSYKDPDRLVMVWENNPQRGWARNSVSWLNFRDWREQSQVFEEIVAVKGWSFTLTGQGEPEQVLGPVVSAGLFRLLGVEPVLGRTFLPEEDRPPTVWLS